MTFKFYLWLLACLLACFHASARAQQAACPPGFIPYGSGTDQSVCGPDNSQRQQQQQQQSLPPVIPMHWETRWGAIATDSTHGILGSANGRPSKEEAQQGALIDCQSKGGQPCKVEAAYDNACAVMTVGHKIHNISWAGTIDKASRLSMKSCSAEDTDCYVYYTACSTPVLVQ